MQALAKKGKFKRALQRSKNVSYCTFPVNCFFRRISGRNLAYLNINVFIRVHFRCLILLYYLKLLQQEISKMGIIIIFAWVSRSQHKANNEKPVLCRLHPKHLLRQKETRDIHQSWHLTNYPEVSPSLSLLPSPPSFPLSHPLSLCLSAVWHQSLQRKGSCNRSSLSPPFALLFISLTVFHSTTNCKPWPLPVFLTRSNLKILSATSVTGGRRKRKGWCLPHFWTNKFASLKSDSMGGLVSQFETSMWPFLFHFTWRFKSNKAYLLAQSFLLWPVKRSFATL